MNFLISELRPTTQNNDRRHSTPMVFLHKPLRTTDKPVSVAKSVDEVHVPLLHGSPGQRRKFLHFMDRDKEKKGSKQTEEKPPSPKMGRILRMKPKEAKIKKKRGSVHKNVRKTDSYMKAMSMPHGTTSSNEQNERWITDARKQMIPDKVDWTVSSFNGAHIWLETDASGCFTLDCKKSGPRKRCAACKLVAHQKCIDQLEKINQTKCRMTYRDASREQEQAESNPQHHWLRRRKQEGRCDSCNKVFQSMLSYKSQKDYVAISCSWCKRAYHIKPECSKAFLVETCDLGFHKNLILPSSWIVKLPPRKYSQITGKRGRQTKRLSSKERRAFVIKPIEKDHKIPLIIFVNPKSGGNQGSRILEKYQYILNPRQVFDLSQGGPKFALELFRKVPNLRILVCGGDGTVGWILSEIDKLKISPPPAVAVLPLGTGNDLSRFLGWGGGYMDEPLSKILSHVEEGEVQRLDRWDIQVSPNQEQTEKPVDDDVKDNSVSKLPLNVMNNYFSMGADADVCLEFHESREANPEKFNSRIKNLYFYGRKGGETVIKRKSKDLYKCIDNLVCDGCDLTEKLRELKPLCLIFLNISSYSAGTSPWGNPNSDHFLPQSCDDGYIEIIGLTSKSMVATQVGGHGIRIYQCQSAMLTTSTKISMQVDGEPCRLNPSKIRINIRNQSSMIAKKKPHRSFYPKSTESIELITPKTIRTKLYYLTFQQYDSLVKFDIGEIKSVVQEVCPIELDPDWQLDDLRKRLETMKITGDLLSSKLHDDWCFLDATWTARIYRIDESQEMLLHVSDILEGGIYVLDCLRRSDSLIPPVNSLLSKSQPNSPPQQRPTNLTTTQLQNHLNNNKENNGIIATTLNNRWNSLDLTPSNMPTTNNLGMACTGSISSDLATSSGSDSDLASDLNSLSSTDSPTATIHSSPQIIEYDLNFQIPDSPSERERELLDAAMKNLTLKFKRLHESGVSLTVADLIGRTPLHIAARHGFKDLVEYIIDRVPMSVLDMADKEMGQTALHKAALYRKRTVCRLLVRKGASLCRHDIEGNTAQHLALKASDTELAKFLQKEEQMQLIAADDHETAV